MNIFWEIFTGLPQQGPGTDEQTAKALSMIPDLPDNPAILDLGCGTGRQTFALADNTNGHITAVDNHQPFLDEIDKKAKSKGLSGRITTVNSSMDSLEMPENSFDLIWSEGAIYNMGFRKGLSYLRNFLKPGGAIAVTEVSWLVTDPPEEVRLFWNSEYPAITTTDKNLQIIDDLGYRLINHFTLPKNAWWDGYYMPLEKKVAKLRQKYSGNTEALKQLDSNQHEIDIYRKYSDMYGYVFYVMGDR